MEINAIKVFPFRVPDDPVDHTANAIIADAQSPTGAWCAEWVPEANDAYRLTNRDGHYIRVPAPVIAKILATPPDISELVVTPAEVAAATGTHESGWRNKAAAGLVPGAVKKGKQWLLPRAALQRQGVDV